MRERAQYIAESSVQASPITQAQRAFFRYQFTLGSLNYAQRHGRRSEVNALSQQVYEHYEEYKALRDGTSVSYDVIAGGSPDLDDPQSPRQPSPLRPNELTPELAEFLKDKDYACLMQATDQGTIFVVRAPARDIQTLRGNVPVRISHELYQHPQAPVIRTVVKWYDQPESPLAMETYTNIGDEAQRADWLDLAERDELRFLFYDRALRHRLSKVVRNDHRDGIAQIAATADQLCAAIPDDKFDFDAAKAAVMARTSL